MKKDNQPTELSYFKGVLFITLDEDHPDKSLDSQFIDQRTELAEQAYEDAVCEGQTIVEALEIARVVLLEGLQFSKVATIRDVLQNEFFREVESEMIDDLAFKLLPKLEAIFSKYKLNDEFGNTPDYEKLYTELTGEIETHFADYVI